jgi:hypothetical protein
MKTDDLISMLATGVEAVDTQASQRRYALAIGGGVAAALLLMALLLKLRHDLLAAVGQPLFWLKVVFVASLAGASLLAVLRLSRPGVRLARAPLAMALPVVVLWAIAAWVLADAEPARRADLFFGSTWAVCPFLIAMLSAPVFVAVIWAMRGLAPTRPRLAGFCAGLFAGAVAALVYCLHCPELEAPFIAFWYLLGMLIPAAVGSLLGERLLSW